MNFKIILFVVVVALVCQVLADSGSKSKNKSLGKSTKSTSKYHHVDVKKSRGKGAEKRGWWWCWWCYPAQNGAPPEEPPPPEEPEQPPPENGGGGGGGGGGQRRRGKNKKSATNKS